MNNQTPDIKVSCAIIEYKGKVLIAQRGLHISNSGTWEFPGGKVEPWENARQCLHREIAEELNISVTIIEELPAVTHQYSDKTITLIPFICTYPGGEITLSDHECVLWKLPHELLMLNLSAADVKVCNHYLKRNLPGNSTGEV